MSSYAHSARFYDAIYADKNYAGEVSSLLDWLGVRGLTGGRALDLGCGTGRHVEHLLARFDCQGLDLQPELLQVAALRLPSVVFHQGDMADFPLDGEFELITSFFGAVGYLNSVARLNQAVAHWAQRLSPGGWLALEGFIRPEEFLSGRVIAQSVDEPDFKLTRMAVSHAEGTLYDTDFHYLLATPAGVVHFTERHQLRMYSEQEFLSAMQQAGLSCQFEPSLGQCGMFLGQLSGPRRKSSLFSGVEAPR